MEQSSSPMIAAPFDESFTMECEAKGNPEPEFRWTKNGQEFDPYQDSRLRTEDGSGTFTIPNNGNLSDFQGSYRCYASNKLGTAITEEIEFIPQRRRHVPKFPKEKINPIEVEEGQSVILECNPPKGIPPLQIYWMTIDLQHIEQDERVSMGLNGNLYFSNALQKDSRRDYCCFASFPRIRTIVQKTAMSVVVKSSAFHSYTHSYTANAILERKPRLLTPSGVKTYTHLVKGEDLLLECIAEGFPTPNIEWVKVGDKLPDRALLENHGKLLTIPEVQDTDDGKYMCKAKNPHGETTHYFHVTVEGKEPPRWEFEPESQLSMIGTDVLIKCAVTGNPKPTVSWKVNGLSLNGAPITSHHQRVFDDKIVLRSATSSDSAVYQCEASNRHGTILANANIMIMSEPVIVTEDSQQYSAIEGKGVVLNCKVFSSPPSTISWSREDSADPVKGERFSVHENGSLEIHKIERDDVGEYSCIAKNTEGSSAITANLDIKDPTRIIDPPQDQRILIGTTAQFSCQARFDSSFSRDFDVFWLKDGIVIALNETEDSGRAVNFWRVSYHQSCLLCCFPDVPDAPEDLMLSEDYGRSAKLKWIPGDDHNSTTSEFIIEFEDSQREPGNWREVLRIPGNHASASLKLHGHVEYRFRVKAVNAIGKSRPSEPTESYKTPATAPDKNPENIKIEGHLPHEMDINWEPLTPIEHNGPGLEYKVSYRQQGVEDNWHEHVVKRHSFVVKNTPTFVPYEIKIHARNHQGWAPEPKVIMGYSGEDFPSAAPDDVAVDVMNNTAVKVSWTRVHKDKLRGHLGGYRVNWWRLRSLLDSRRFHEDKHTLTFPGDRGHALIPGLRPFSEYSLIVMAFNSRGNGPGSHAVNFRTPEGVPDRPSAFRAVDIQKHSVSLSWARPIEAHGLLVGFLLQYQMINDTEEVGPLLTINISNPESSKWLLQDLEPVSKYKLYMRACTRVGCGPAASEECTTSTEARELPVFVGIVGQRGQECGWMLNSCHEGHCFTTRSKGNWKISEPVNASKTFHVIEGLEPGTEYTVRLMAKNWVDNSSIFEDVIRTKAKGLASIHGGISNQSWFIGLMCAVALLTLTLLIACFVNRNKGGKYSVKEKEDLHPDVESQGMNDDTFCEYSDNDEKPLKGSLHSHSGDIKPADSGDSLVDYGDEEGQFNEDGSFIGEYAGRKERASVEIKGTGQTAA
uniref:Neural cell adhesion molecule L1-like protein n=1 Tax=Denticeps clupeoides TaxID=299321 RepID=A0AAY4DLY2_9TELE